jgi:hypothetical protein
MVIESGDKEISKQPETHRSTGLDYSSAILGLVT